MRVSDRSEARHGRLTVYTQIKRISIPSEKNTQLVHVEMLAPLNKVATITAAMAIVCTGDQPAYVAQMEEVRTVENSYRYTSQPSVRDVGVKYVYKRKKKMITDWRAVSQSPIASSEV